MEDLQTAQTYGFSLIDVSASSDDDFLLASSDEPSIVDNPGCICPEGVPMNQPSDPSALHRPRKTGKCNLRKSLAWDSAFFTNAGVLDPEELSSIIEGADSGVKQNPFLPGIQEELSKSTDSISTFQSDNLTLEGLEADLFCDVRASIQRCSKSSNIGNSCGSDIRGEDNKKGCSTKEVELPSRKLAKPKSASNKLNSGAQGPVRTLKPGFVRKEEKMKPPVNRSREPGSLLPRPLKAAGGPSLQVAATSKRMSVGAGRVKPDAKAAGIVKGAGKGASLAEASNSVDSRKLLPKAPALSKISSASSVVNRTTTRSSRSSCDSSSSSASERVRKSQTGVIRKKMDKIVNLPSGSKSRISTKDVEKVKSQNKDLCLSAYLKSTSNLSSSISPASSISEWSTESCSSTATINQKHFGFNPCTLSSQDVTAGSNVSQNLHNLSSDRALGNHDNQVPGIISQPVKQPSIGSVLSSTRPGSAKPSGLRMPSPNIGFFDGVKAGAKTPSSSRSRSALPGSLPKSVAGMPSPYGATSKTRLGTSASKIAAAAVVTAKPKQRITDANLKTAVHLLDHSVDLQNPSGAKHIENDHKTCSKLPRSILPKSALERNKNDPETSNLGKFARDSQPVGEDNLASDLASVEIPSEFPSISPKSALERNDKIPEVSYTGKYVPDNFASDLLSVCTEDEPKPDPQSLEANLKPTAFSQDQSVGFDNPPSASGELLETDVFKSLNDTRVAKVTDGGRQVLQLASVAEDNLVASEKKARQEGKVLITNDLVNVTAEDRPITDPQITYPNLMPTLQLQGHSDDLQVSLRAKNADDNFGTSFELSKTTSCSSASVTDNKVPTLADGGKHALPDIVSVAKDDLIAPETEGILELTNDVVIVASGEGSSTLDTTCVQISCVSPPSNLEHRNNSSSIVCSLSPPSQHVDEADNLEIISQYAQGEGGSVGHGTTDENQSLETVLLETKENVYAEKQVEESEENMKAIDNKMEMLGHGTTDENQSLETGLLETKENVYAEKQVEESEENMKPIDNKMEMHEEPDRNVHSETKVFDKVTSTVSSSFKESCELDKAVSPQFESLISCSPPLSSLGIGSTARTPFTVKNTVSNVVEMSNSSIGSATESFLKVDVVSSLEKPEKENC